MSKWFETIEGTIVSRLWAYKNTMLIDVNINNNSEHDPINKDIQNFII